jgi:histidine phosphotransferase ChpT
MANPTIDIRILELLCSRLCHELISPVAAISNGLELLGEESADTQSEVAGLLAYSSAQAAQRLQFYRLAYGFGAGQASTVGLGQAGDLMRGMVDPDKIDITWPTDADAAMPSRLGIKVIINPALLGIEALPRGGELVVSVSDKNGFAFSVNATGIGAGLHEESAAALAVDTNVDALTPRSVHAHFVALLVAAAGGGVSYAQPGDEVATITAHLPAGC